MMMEIVRSISKMNPIVSWGYFEFLDLILRKYLPKNLARNALAGSHAIISTALAGACIYTENGDDATFNSLYTMLKIYSSGYLIYDSCCTLRDDKLTLTRWAWLYHHVSTFLYIHTEPKIYDGHKIMFWAELSNIPSYFVYYYIKTGQLDTSKYKFLSALQKLLYVGIRIPVLGNLTNKKLQSFVKDKRPVYMVLPVYLMGLIWSAKLLNNSR